MTDEKGTDVPEIEKEQSVEDRLEEKLRQLVERVRESARRIEGARRSLESEMTTFNRLNGALEAHQEAMQVVMPERLVGLQRELSGTEPPPTIVERPVEIPPPKE